MPFLNYKALKQQLRVFLAGHTVAMVTYYVMERTTMCSPIIGQWLDTIIVASSDKEWLQWPIETLVLETVLSYLKKPPSGSKIWVQNISRSDGSVQRYHNKGIHIEFVARSMSLWSTKRLKSWMQRSLIFTYLNKISSRLGNEMNRKLIFKQNYFTLQTHISAKQILNAFYKLKWVKT